MSKQKHKGFRKVLKIEYSTISDVPVTLVYWCLVDRETSRSLYSTHIGLTAYCGVKNRGVTALMYHKAVRIDKKKLDLGFHINDLSKAATEAYFNSLKSNNRTGTVSWYHRGVGFIKDDLTGTQITVYGCNIKGANSMHHDLVTNVSLNSKDKVQFDLKDAHTTKNCGACNVRKVA